MRVPVQPSGEREETSSPHQVQNMLPSRCFQSCGLMILIGRFTPQLMQVTVARIPESGFVSVAPKFVHTRGDAVC